MEGTTIGVTTEVVLDIKEAIREEVAEVVEEDMEEVMKTIDVAEEVVVATTQTITKEDNFTGLMLLQVVESHKDLNQIFV